MAGGSWSEAERLTSLVLPKMCVQEIGEKIVGTGLVNGVRDLPDTEKCSIDDEQSGQRKSGAGGKECENTVTVMKFDELYDVGEV